LSNNTVIKYKLEDTIQIKTNLDRLQTKVKQKLVKGITWQSIVQYEAVTNTQECELVFQWDQISYCNGNTKYHSCYMV